MKILITGSAGFIGSALTLALLKENHSIIGIDNLNNYYDSKLKTDRLNRYIGLPDYTHYHVDIENDQAIEFIYAKHKPEVVINLAGQPGVQHSFENPNSYINSNIVGFVNLLEASKKHQISHFIYASSSSVYGESSKTPFSTTNPTDSPTSLYAATKKAGEIIAHSYSHAFGLKTTGLRFFTVYGPWGRPDMAPSIFAESITNQKKIRLFDHGNHLRDFTYIDDVVEGIHRVIEFGESKLAELQTPYQIHNIGNGKPTRVVDFVSLLEQNFETTANVELLPKRSWDVQDTHADMRQFEKQFNSTPKTSTADGVKMFCTWFKEYYQTPREST